MALRVVFLHYHGIGHLNPCFPLARILAQQSHKVWFAGAGYFREHVIQQGFLSYPLSSVPFGLGFETWVNTIGKKKNLYYSTLRDRITDRIYADRERGLLEMIADLNPDVIFIDGTQATDFIVLYPHLLKSNIRVGIIHAMFPTYVVSGRPPVNSNVFPEDNRGAEVAVRLMKARQSKKALRQKLKFMFFDDRYIVDRRLRQNQIPEKYRSKLKTLFYYSTDSITELVLSPREFDYPTFDPPTHHRFIGFMMNPITPVVDPDYLQVRQIIMDEASTHYTKVIYCSFGTIEFEHRQTIIGFLNKLIQATGNLGFRLVVSTGPHHTSLNELADADHVYRFASIPQLDILTFTDVFVTHGGLSSIKESIHAGVPMLMYPVHTDFDPIGNAARVAYHGLGLLGDVNSDSVSDIQNKILELVNNVKFIKNVARLRKINLAYTPEKFLGVFENLTTVR